MSERGVRVRALRWEAEGVLSLELEAADGGRLPDWEPGAHIDLLLPNGLERQYSLCGQPGAPDWRVAVLREVAGRGGSAWVHDELRVGTLLTARGPRNNFPLQAAPEYTFIAGGIGITPILPMIDHAAGLGASWHLYYGGRGRTSMAFLDQLSRYGLSVTVRPEDEFGLLDIGAMLEQASPEGAVYCCGPAPLLDAVTTRCCELDRELHIERFTPVIDPEAARVGGGFEVYLQRSRLALSVSDGESILEAVEAAGVNPPCSCLEGTCGTCETRVLEGVPDHRDSLLTEEERAAGETMMICVSRAASPRLVLDL